MLGGAAALAVDVWLDGVFAHAATQKLNQAPSKLVFHMIIASGPSDAWASTVKGYRNCYVPRTASLRPRQDREDDTPVRLEEFSRSFHSTPNQPASRRYQSTPPHYL
jgi:hypothetical protein